MSRKGIQRNLPFPDAPSLAPATGRREPVLWIRRLLLWQDVTEPPVRNVRLYRGLNIVWSPVGSDRETFAIGHAAGKSLFCRLLRYCLGEQSFADPEDTASIRARFPNGAVGAEVRLCGETWAVRRRFTVPAEDLAAKVEGIDQLLSSGGNSFEKFVGALQEAVFAPEHLQLLSELKSIQPWQFLIAWLTRDQECRMDNLTHWRHPDSSSQSPVQHAQADTKRQVLRVVLGLYSTQSSLLRKKVTDASSMMNRAKGARKEIEARSMSLQQELATALEIDLKEVWPPPDGILQDEEKAREAHQQSLLARADKRIRKVMVVKSDPDHARDAERLSQMSGQLARLKEQIASRRAEGEIKLQRVKLLEPEKIKRWSEYREAKSPVCPFDGTLIDVEASKSACPLVRLPDPEAAKQIAKEAEAELEAARRELKDSEAALGSLREEYASLKVTAEALARSVEARDAAAASQVVAAQTAWATKGLVHRFFELRGQLDEALRAESAAGDELKTHQAKQVAALSDYSTATVRLQHWFAFLVRRVIAPEATGTVTLDGKGLHPKIKWGGTRRSVALNSLQVVLFDLAAMLCAVEGHSQAPAFLVHDSPREGDLDPWTYGRIFEAALELGPEEDTAPFQYIVTTTTEPPDGHVRARVRLELGSDTEEHRLFQKDL